MRILLNLLLKRSPTMTKAFKYLLLACMLPLSGYSLFHTTLNRHTLQGSPLSLLECTLSTSPDADAPGRHSVVSSLVSGPDDTTRICTETREEESFGSMLLKTFSETNKYITTLTAPVFSTSASQMKSTLLICKHWFYASSHRNIILRVMRI